MKAQARISTKTVERMVQQILAKRMSERQAQVKRTVKPKPVAKRVKNNFLTEDMIKDQIRSVERFAKSLQTNAKTRELGIQLQKICDHAPHTIEGYKQVVIGAYRKALLVSQLA